MGLIFNMAACTGSIPEGTVTNSSTFTAAASRHVVGLLRRPHASNPQSRCNSCPFPSASSVQNLQRSNFDLRDPEESQAVLNLQ